MPLGPAWLAESDSSSAGTLLEFEECDMMRTDGGHRVTGHGFEFPLFHFSKVSCQSPKSLTLVSPLELLGIVPSRAALGAEEMPPVCLAWCLAQGWVLNTCCLSLDKSLHDFSLLQGIWVLTAPSALGAHLLQRKKQRPNLIPAQVGPGYGREVGRAWGAKLSCSDL